MRNICSSCEDDSIVSFHYVKLKSNEFFSLTDNAHGLLVFHLVGEVNVYSLDIGVKQSSGGSFFYIPPKALWNLQSQSDSTLLILPFEASKFSCVKVIHELTSSRKHLDRPARTEMNKATILSIHPTLNDIILTIEKYLCNDIHCKCLYRHKQHELFLILYNLYPISQYKMLQEMVDKQNKFKSIIYKKYKQQKDVKEFAQDCGYTERTFTYHFKKNFDTSVYQWLLKERAKYVYRDIIINGLSFKEIVAKYDFSSDAHFNKFCNTYFGCNPRDVRQFKTSPIITN